MLLLTDYLTPRQIEKLNTVHIDTVRDLLNYYPFRYEEFEVKLVSQWQMNDKVKFEGVLMSLPKKQFFGAKKSITRFQIMVENVLLNVTLFNWMYKLPVTIGDKIWGQGVYQGQSKLLVHKVQTTPQSFQESITPVYSINKSIKQHEIKKCILKVFEKCRQQLTDDIPSKYVKKYALLDYATALEKIHFPKDMQSVKEASRTLKYREFLYFYLALVLLKQANIEETHKQPKQFEEKKIQQLINTLPYELTSGQIESLQAILSDLKKQTRMYRLLQGDVGCGKTIVASIAMYACALSNYQCALLAPTEILAKQHYETLCNLLKEFSIKIALLYSGLSIKEKNQIYEKLKNGEIQMIVGTHALLTEKVVFHNLGLVVADEQHRFGVQQRKQLLAKGDKVDFLLMSATPIPRTLALSLYGDMEISTIETMPKNRKPVETILIKENGFFHHLKEIEARLDKGEQVYVICSAITESETLNVRNSEAVYEKLKEIFKNKYEVGLLHGKMKEEDKYQTMQAFYDNEIQILISTTVVEVGVNVVNATVMIIYDADRFGLSQLHQLRGRVQRGSKKGVCYLLTGSQNPESLKRLEILVNSYDGFEISNEDLKLRGPGDILGVKQSGVPGFILGDLFKDENIVEVAKKDAEEIIHQQDILENKKLVEKIIKENAIEQYHMD